MFMFVLFAAAAVIAPLLVPEHQHRTHIVLHLFQFLAMVASLYVVRRFGKLGRPLTVLFMGMAIVVMLGILLLIIGHSLALSANTP